MRDIREIAGIVLITAGLVSAYFARDDLSSLWLWGGLATAAVGIFLVSRAIARHKPDPLPDNEYGPLDGLEIPDTCHRPRPHDIGPDDFD